MEVVPAQETLLVVTLAEVRLTQVAPFYAQSRRVLLDLEGRPGRLAHDIRIRRLGLHAWTFSWWRDEASMRGFINGEEHFRAVARSRRLLSGVTTWMYMCPEGVEAPSWGEVDVIRSGQTSCRSVDRPTDRNAENAPSYSSGTAR